MSPEAVFPTSKRSACDRCRSQKLRCPPRESASESCSRCTRLGARCTTSYPRPPGRRGGRGSATSGAAHLSRPMLRHRGTTSSSTRAPLPSQEQASSATSDSSSSSPKNYTSIAVTAAIDTACRPTTYPDLHPALTFDLSEHNLDVFAPKHMGTVSACSVPYHDRTQTVVAEALYLDFNTISSPPSQPSSICNNAGMAPDRTGRQNQLHDQVRRRGISMEVLECDERLSTLSANLSRHHQQCLELSEARSAERPSADLIDIQGHQESRSSKLFGDALGYTAEFLAIIESYRSANVRGASMTGAMYAGNSDTSSTRVGLIIILNLISAYLQITALYEKLFHDLCQQLSNHPAGSGLQILPGLQLAGFSVQQGSMQTKILVQAVLYQFEKIERCLGLSVDLRVTDKQEAYYAGLFDDERARIILEAVSNSKWSHIAMDDNSGLKALSSLKDKIRRAQAYLDT